MDVLVEKSLSQASDAAPRVLVVDDEEAILSICREHLTKAGCTVWTAGSAPAALEILQSHAADVLVSDFSMPGSTGADLLELARVRFPDTVRILFTGLGDTHIAEEAMVRGGVFRFLVKPFSAEGLVSCVQDGAHFRRLALERRRHEEERELLLRAQADDLAVSRALLEGFFDVLPTGFLVSEGNGIISRANPAACEILGFPPGSLVGRQAGEAGVPAGLTEEGRETDWTTPGGVTRSLLWTCRRLHSESGRASRTVLSFLDVTKRFELERKVSQGKRDIEAVFDSVTEPMAVVDSGGAVLRANEAFRQLAKRPWGEFLGKNCSELLAFIGAVPACRPIAQALESGQQRQEEWRADDGKILHARVFPVFEGGQVNGAVIRLQDITAEREMEHRLLQSEKMASIGQLAAGMAHEINNPVGFIASGLNRLAEHAGDLGVFRDRTRRLFEAVSDGSTEPRAAWESYGDVVRETDLDFVLRDVADIVAECREGADRIRKIVCDLKTFSHPDGGEWQHFDLNQGLDSTLNIVWNELKYKCEVVKEYGDLPALLCRPQQVNQVFMNLLVNAAQAIPERGTIRLRTWAEPGERHICVSVADTGVGISAADQRKIFEPFFTTKPVGKGTGLGLHLAAGIVHRHGGEIRVVSEPGQGAVFTVILPVEPPDAHLEESR